MAHYEVSEDGKRVVFVRTDRGNRGVWLARTHGQLAPRQLSSDANTYAFFGPRETVVFVATEGGRRYLARMREDGTAREAIVSTPFIGLVGVSPDRQWALMWVNYDERKQLVGYPLQGGQPVLVCERCADSRGGPARGRTPPALTWSPGGRHVYLRLQWPAEPLYETGKTYVLPLSEPGGLPPDVQQRG